MKYLPKFKPIKTRSKQYGAYKNAELKAIFHDGSRIKYLEEAGYTVLRMIG